VIKRILRATAAVGVALAVFGSSTAYAACYTVNVYYYNQSMPVGTACLFNYDHGNIYGAAFSKIQRLPRPPGYPYYCSQAGTRVTGTGWVNGSIALSSTAWAQSTVTSANLIYSKTYGYDGGASYYEEDNSPFC
jgi:hypothetical protein